MNLLDSNVLLLCLMISTKTKKIIEEVILVKG